MTDIQSDNRSIIIELLQCRLGPRCPITYEYMYNHQYIRQHLQMHHPILMRQILRLNDDLNLEQPEQPEQDLEQQDSEQPEQDLEQIVNSEVEQQESYDANEQEAEQNVYIIYRQPSSTYEEKNKCITCKNIFDNDQYAKFKLVCCEMSLCVSCVINIQKTNDTNIQNSHIVH